MFKLVVLSTLLAVAVAKPGLVSLVAPVAAPLAPAVAIPTAVSHQSRTDIVSRPVVAAYASAPAIAVAPAAPAVAIAEAPAVAVAPTPVAIPTAVSHQFRTDFINRPLIASYATAPVIAPIPLGYGYGPHLGYHGFRFAAPFGYPSHNGLIHAW